jgi:hypothetical protein
LPPRGRERERRGPSDLQQLFDMDIPEMEEDPAEPTNPVPAVTRLLEPLQGTPASPAVPSPVAPSGMLPPVKAGATPEGGPPPVEVAAPHPESVGTPEDASALEVPMVPSP